MHRNAQHWEINVYLDLIEGLYQALLHFKEGTRLWEWENNETFLVNFYYGVLAKEKVARALQPHKITSNFPFRRI